LNQIICVHAGNFYSNEYVEKLFNSCKRNISQPFEFVVLSDRTEYNINESNFKIVKLYPYNFVGHRTLWWYKMQAFRPDIVQDEQNLLLDIDQVIVGDLDKFFNYANDKFVIIQDFNRHWNINYSKSNSSVIKFTKDIADVVYSKWIKHPEVYAKQYRGDQDWFDDEISDKAIWPFEWIKSWKWEVYRGGQIKVNSNKYFKDTTEINSTCSILSFHGKPKPDEVHEEIIISNWR